MAAKFACLRARASPQRIREIPPPDYPAWQRWRSGRFPTYDGDHVNGGIKIARTKPAQLGVEDGDMVGLCVRPTTAANISNFGR